MPLPGRCIMIRPRHGQPTIEFATRWRACQLIKIPVNYRLNSLKHERFGRPRLQSQFPDVIMV